MSYNASVMSVVAVLAPTNTGKTHRAVERMLESKTGMLGLPLRLLAREVYDRVTARIGETQVALITGEEKRVPGRVRYWVCTVESMPISQKVDFLAVDEIQLAAHRRRGHVFTDRLLNARGREETWFLGAETMRPLIRTLLPDAEIRRHQRLSRLTHVGSRSLRTLPPRSAVVGFSASQVYQFAERLRERRGGVAVVLGALSPRTRNAQVALYQSGEVQYMVATDAIGMGLNMDVDHVAFAALRKFDGVEERPLTADELAQIAGRAGRYQTDGTFGTLSSVPTLPKHVVRSIESHRFPAVKRLIWRNSDLDMRSIDTLLGSLARPPGHSALELVDYADDFRALSRLSTNPEIREHAHGEERVALLWDVCQIPDFRKLLEESHVRLLAEIFIQLAGPSERLSTDWMNQRINRLDHVEGDIDALMSRIAFIRTWTYISHHAAWVNDAGHWRERTRAIEDRLSDALHERLVQRFVARRRVRPVKVEVPDSSPFSKLRDLLEMPADSSQGWVDALVDAGHERFQADATGAISFDDTVVAKLSRGSDLLHPELVVQLADLGAAAHTRIGRRLTAFARDLVAEALGPLRDDRSESLSPAGRGLIYQLEQGLGAVMRRQAAPQLEQLTEADRRLLRALDIRLGRRVIYARSLLGGPALARRRALVAPHWPVTARSILTDMRPNTVSMPPVVDVSSGLYLALGYLEMGPRALRIDMAERVHRTLADLARGEKSFEAPAELSSWIGCKRALIPDIVAAFGYRQTDDGRFARPPRRGNRRRRPRKRR